MFGRILSGFAIFANILVVLAIVFFLIMEANRAQEILILIVCLFPPVLSLLVLFQIPDFEERKLARKVRKARLKRELKELEG